MEKVIISNPSKFEDKKKRIIQKGIDKFHVLADFDRTLTKATTPSIISVLRDYDYLDKDYSNKAKELFNKYHTIEIDSSISMQEKKKAMHEWWTRHFKLLIKKGLNKKHLERIISEEKIHLRGGILEFLDFLHKKNIPLVILSSSGVGDAIPMYFKKQKKLYENIHVISNLYDWDSKGNAIKVREPIIHAMNKDEASIKSLPIYNELLKRKNVLLLGDSLGDLEMIKGFDYNNLLSVGFLNQKVEENLEDYKKNFDAIILNDGNFDFINGFLKEFKY